MSIAQLPDSWGLAQQVAASVDTSATGGQTPKRNTEIMRGAMKAHAGWYSVETQTWRLAVPMLAELRDYLLHYYWEALADDAVQRELLLNSVWQFIADASNYKKAAASLFVHENTLRYRIAKFEELTGADLSFADTRVELLWIQHALALTR